MRLRRVFLWCLGSFLALGLVAGVVVGVRRAGGSTELEAALAHTPEDEGWLASLPRVDPDVRARAWAWMKSEWPEAYGSSAKDEAWFLAGEAPPAKLLERHEAEREHMEALTALLDTPGLCLSSIAWADTDREDHPSLGPRHIPNLLSCRYAQRWYGIETMLAEEPAPALEASERLFAAMRPAGCLIDALIHIAMADTRDRIHLRLLQRGRLSEAHLARWLDEAPGADTLLLDGYRGERLLALEPVGHAILRGTDNVLKALYGDDTDVRAYLDYVWHARRDVAMLVRAHRRVEAYVRGEITDPGFDELASWQRDGGLLASMGMPNHGAVLWSVLYARAQHRLSRLLGRTVRLSGEPPATEAELRERLPEAAAWMDAGRLDLAIRYERIRDDRIRFYVPADTPLPACAESMRAGSGLGSKRPDDADESPLPAGRLAAEMQIPR